MDDSVNRIKLFQTILILKFHGYFLMENILIEFKCEDYKTRLPLLPVEHPVSDAQRHTDWLKRGVNVIVTIHGLKSICIVDSRCPVRLT